MTLPSRFHVGNLVVDLEAYRLVRAGEPVHLTRTEWALLGELARHHGQVLTHRTLLQRIWGDEYFDEIDYIHTYVRRLRRKLEDDPGQPQYLLTEPGIGYRLEFFSDGEPVVPAAASTGESAPAPGTRTRNPLPQAVSDRFVGRRAAQTHLTDVLLSGANLLMIVGRSGVGKTALACKVLSDLSATDHYAGMVYLSADRMDISLGRIVTDFAALLPSDELADIATLTPVQRISQLLAALVNGRYLLLLDNLEDGQDHTSGALLDPDLQALVETLLVQGGGLQLLVTSSIPVALPRHLRPRGRVIELSDGLPVDDAVTLLRRCDPDGGAGLRDADDTLLSQIAERTGGFPRALEAVAGLLLDDPLLTPADLLADDALFNGEVGAVVVESAINRLDAPARAMMDALAVLDRPVPRDAIEFLLDPCVEYDAAGLHAALNRLVRAFYCIYDRDSGTFALHNIDQAYCYSRIPTAGDGCTLRALHRRAADYYQHRALPPEQWLDVTEVEPQRAEFYHRVRAGEHEAAARLLLTLDRDYLWVWGQFAALATMHEQLRGHLHDADLSRHHLLRLGEAYRALGRVGAAVACFEEVLTRTDAAGQRAWADATSGLGWAYYDLGQFERARTALEEAEAAYHALDDLHGRGSTLGGRGWVSFLLGDYAAAADLFQAAFKLLIEQGALYAAGINLGDLGAARLMQGHYAEAASILREALTIADRFKAPREKSYKRGYLALALLLDDRVAEGYEVIDAAQRYDVPENNHLIAALAGIILARLGQSEAARYQFEAAIQYADRLLIHTDNLYRAYFSRGLAGAGLIVTAGAASDPVLMDYQRARGLCDAAGVLAFNRLLLSALASCDPHDRLAPMRTVLT